MFQTCRPRMTSPGKSCDEGERQDDYRERDQNPQRQHSTPSPIFVAVVASKWNPQSSPIIQGKPR